MLNSQLMSGHVVSLCFLGCIFPRKCIFLLNYLNQLLCRKTLAEVLYLTDHQHVSVSKGYISAQTKDLHSKLKNVSSIAPDLPEMPGWLLFLAFFSFDFAMKLICITSGKWQVCHTSNRKNCSCFHLFPPHQLTNRGKVFARKRMSKREKTRKKHKIKKKISFFIITACQYDVAVLISFSIE